MWPFISYLFLFRYIFFIFLSFIEVIEAIATIIGISPFHSSNFSASLLVIFLFIFICACIYDRVIYFVTGINVATKKPTNQSSTVRGGAATNANDGEKTTVHDGKRCTETMKETSPWWQVDLLRAYPIRVIRVTTRGCCGKCIWLNKIIRILYSNQCNEEKSRYQGTQVKWNFYESKFKRIWKWIYLRVTTYREGQ